MLQLTQFGVALPPGQVRLDGGTGPSVAHAIALPGGGVYDVAGTRQAAQAAPRWRLRATLVGTDEGDLRAQSNALQQMIGQRRTLWRRWGCDGPSESIAARLEEITWHTDARLPLVLPLELRFLLLAPYWQGSRYTLGGAVGTTLAAANPGTATVTAALCTVIPSSTMPNGVRVVNSTLGVGWHYTAALSVGDKLEVDSTARTVTVNDLPAFSPFTLVGGHSFWLPLAPGGNTLTLTAPGGGAGTVTVEYAEGWV